MKILQVDPIEKSFALIEVAPRVDDWLKNIGNPVAPGHTLIRLGDPYLTAIFDNNAVSRPCQSFRIHPSGWSIKSRSGGNLAFRGKAVIVATDEEKGQFQDLTWDMVIELNIQFV